MTRGRLSSARPQTDARIFCARILCARIFWNGEAFLRATVLLFADQAQRSIGFGNFQRFAKRRLDGVDHRRRIGDPAGPGSDQGIGHVLP
jgi:hypothetical protein